MMLEELTKCERTLLLSCSMEAWEWLNEWKKERERNGWDNLHCVVIESSLEYSWNFCQNLTAAICAKSAMAAVCLEWIFQIVQWW